MPRLGIIGSTRGTNMLALIAAIKSKQLQASIEVVISNKEDAIILQRAKEHNLQAKYINPKNISIEMFDTQLSAALRQHNVDLVVLIGYMRILSPAFVSQWQGKLINVHPSLLPLYAGKMNEDVHREVLAAKLPETGCTVHQVTAEVDAGPILLQKKCMVLPRDTVETLKARVQHLEGETLIEVINQFRV